MHILYFSGSKVPSQNAQSVHCMKMAEAFAKAGHEVTLFAKGVIGASKQEIFDAYGTEDCFRLELSSFINIPLISGAARWMDMSGKVRRAPKPHLVYGADPVALALLCPSGAKIVFEAHELPDVKSTKAWAFQKLIKYPNFKGIVAASDVLMQDFIDAYPTIEAEKIFVAHDGAEIIDRISDRSTIPVSLPGRSGALQVGYIGSLHAGKGISFIGHIAQLRPDYDFHIVGGTEKHIQAAENENLYPNLFFHGHRNHADIPAYLSAFDVVLAPYQHDSVVKTGHNTMRWLSPIKIFEYMAAGKPIICSDLPILQEILQHEYNAIMLSPSEEQSWAHALDVLKQYPEFARQIAANAFEELASKYTWDKRAQAILKFCIEKPKIFQMAKAS